MNPLGWIQGLEGLILAAVICGLLFVEESGVPLPFAPGDLLLAIAGIAIAAGRVEPALMVLLAFGAIVVGALAGREAFALVGWERLMRVAGPLHARVPLERASGMLARSGWRAVFMARLIPGLRVHTTQVAGVSGMPRLTFAAGLLPATAVYVAAFVGLGAAFGRPVLHVIHQVEHQLLLLVLVVAPAAALVLASRVVLRHTLVSAGGWAGVFAFRLGSPAIVLVPAGIGINVAGHAAAVALGLPLFLDSTGTILCGMLAGPWVGGSVGLITNLVAANTFDPIAAPYSVVAFAIGFAAGLAGYANRGDRWPGWLALWPVCFVLASVMSTPLNLLFNDGRSGVPLGDAVTVRLADLPVSPLIAAYAGEAAVDLPDKLLAVLAALAIYRCWPRRPAVPGGPELDLAGAFTAVFRSERWPTRMLAGAVCVLLSWLVVPGLLFAGYTVAVARGVHDGGSGLPAWDHLGRKLVDGVLVILLIVAWNLPGAVLGLPAALAGGGAVGGVAGVLATLGGAWWLLVVALAPAITSQYLSGGFAAALDPAAVVRRVRVNAGLTLVIGALGLVLGIVALSGLFAVLVGVAVTLPYASWVGADLVGRYARLTDPTLISS